MVGPVVPFSVSLMAELEVRRLRLKRGLVRLVRLSQSWIAWADPSKRLHEPWTSVVLVGSASY